MFRSIWFWVITIGLGLALWLGRDQIASYFDKLPMNAQPRTTNTQLLASVTPSVAASHATSSGSAVILTVTPQSSTGIASSSSVSSASVATASVPHPSPTSTTHYTTYVVKKGDTLYSISRRYKTTVKDLQRINSISDPATLYVGQELKVPAPASSPKPTAPVVKAGTTTYTVQKGDSLSSIARKFGTSVGTLQKLNNFANPNDLVVGSVILVPAASKSVTVTASPSGGSSTNGEVHALPVISSPSSPSGSSATAQPAGPTVTPTPSPIPTMPSACGGAQDAVFVWGVSFCIPPGWSLQEYAQPNRTALLTKDEVSGDRSIYAISRIEGYPNAPLSWSMRQARKSVTTELATLIHGGLAEPETWSLATALRIDDVEGQMSEARTTYLKTGHAARVRVIVFNYGDQRWRIVIVAPEELWQGYNVTVYPYIVRTLEVF